MSKKQKPYFMTEAFRQALLQSVIGIVNLMPDGDLPSDGSGVTLSFSLSTQEYGVVTVTASALGVGFTNKDGDTLVWDQEVGDVVVFPRHC